MSFPDGFLWGASTAAHQTEGNNLASDWWTWEHHSPGASWAMSGDACDSYHRYGEDMRLLAEAGLNAYRFSVEWARIEPEDGEISRAEVDHYRRMVDTCLSVGMQPVVTLHHFTNPQWFAQRGGWTGPGAADRFARYVEAVAPVIADGVEYVCTFNEPNFAALMEDLRAHPDDVWGRNEPGTPVPNPAVVEALTLAHHRTVDQVRAIGPKAGWTVATQAYQAVDGAEDVLEDYAWPRERRFLDEAREDDFVGVQAYSRNLIGPDGPLPVPAGATITLGGLEYWPRALGEGIALAWKCAPGVPVLVTENGIPTKDDQERIAYTADAIRSMEEQIAAGVDVRGYLHWSALDNYEWGHYEPTFGLIAVDRSTFKRTPKPSLAWLGRIARENGATVSAISQRREQERARTGPTHPAGSIL